MAGNLLLAGYIGAGNHGDDAIMHGFATAAESVGLSCTALSGNPDETFRNFQMRSYNRRENAQIEMALKECDALVFPGGSIFQDVTSTRSVLYYSNLVKKAKTAGKKVCLVGQGVGPLTSFLGKRMALSAFKSADLVAVRDPGSMQTLQTLGLRSKIHMTADSAFLLRQPLKLDEEVGFAVGQMKTVGIAPRPLGKGRDVAALIGDFCRLLFQSGTMPVLIAMDREEDIPLNLEIAKRQGGKIPDIHKSVTPMQIQQRISRMDGIVAMRLHAAILATTVLVPPLMISYDPKVSAFARLLDVGSALPMDGLTPQRLMDAYVAFSKDRDRNSKLIERKRDEMVKLAMKNVDLVLECAGASAKL